MKITIWIIVFSLFLTSCSPQILLPLVGGNEALLNLVDSTSIRNDFQSYDLSPVLEERIGELTVVIHSLYLSKEKVAIGMTVSDSNGFRCDLGSVKFSDETGEPFPFHYAISISGKSSNSGIEVRKGESAWIIYFERPAQDMKIEPTNAILEITLVETSMWRIITKTEQKIGPFSFNIPDS